MKYEKPEVTLIVVEVSVYTNASELSSCDGGHCVKAMYSGDH